ncbi:MAG: sugar phosphate isomerase/epimerase family protein [Planctomycetota bacterium]
MQLSAATAGLYFRPFEQALGIIAEAGLRSIELDLFWERKDGAMAQHLRDVPVKRAVRLIERSGLRISSIHDTGGVLDNTASMDGFINPTLDQYLDEVGYAPECLVFHTPHIEGDPGSDWWERISDKIVSSLEKYREACSFVTIENMPSLPGYYVPLATPRELDAFVTANGLGVTFDTTHYAQMGFDITEAAGQLRRSIRTIHLSDFEAGRTHVFVGDGDLDLPALFDVIDKNGLSTVTLECSLSSHDKPDEETSYSEMVARMREARIRVERIL